MMAITNRRRKSQPLLNVLILRLVDTITRCQCLSTLPREKVKGRFATKSLVETKFKTQTYYNFSKQNPQQTTQTGDQFSGELNNYTNTHTTKQ